MSVPKVPVGSIDTSKPFNQDLEEVRQLVYTRPTKEEISYGFETSGLTRFPQTPTILRCHADFKTIYVVWDRQSNNNHIDHYRVQVSDDKVGWRELRFDGKDWGYDPFPEIEEPPEGEDYSPQTQVFFDSYTITYSNEIAHTAIPYREDGAVQRLFYRVKAVTKNGDESRWSEPAEGSTYYIGQSDIRTDEFVYQPSGGFNMSEYTPELGNFQGATITLGPNSYYGSGDITFSGDATVLEENFYEYSASGSVTFSGSANFSIEGDFVYTGIQGGIDYSGTATVAAAETTLVFSATSTLVESPGVGYVGAVHLCTINDTEHIIIYKNSVDELYAVSATRSGSSYTIGTPEFIAGTFHNAKACHLDGNKFVVSWNDGSQESGSSRIGTLVGGNISFTSPSIFHASSSSKDIIGMYQSVVSSSAFVVTYTLREDIFVDGALEVWARAATTNGSSISWGLPVQLRASSSNEYVSIPRSSELDETHIAIGWVENTTKRAEAIVGELTGNALSFGTKQTLYSPGTIYGVTDLEVELIDSSSFLSLWRYNDAVYGNVCSVTGTTIDDVGQVNTVDDRTNTIDLNPFLSGDTMIFAYWSAGTIKGRILSIDGENIGATAEDTAYYQNYGGQELNIDMNRTGTNDGSVIYTDINGELRIQYAYKSESAL